MLRRNNEHEIPQLHHEPPPPVSVSVDELFGQANAAHERLKNIARHILPRAVERRDHYATILQGHQAPEDHVRPEHVAIAALCEECERFLSLPHERLEWAKTQYLHSQQLLLAFVNEEVTELETWVSNRRSDLGVHPQYADEIRIKISSLNRYTRYRDQFATGRGHEVPRLQNSQEGWATDFFTANVDAWGHLAELAPMELIPYEQVLHDMPDFLAEICDELKALSEALYQHGVANNILRQRQPPTTPMQPPASSIMNGARLVRR